MTHFRDPEIRRRADGSIDTGFYAARAEAMRRIDRKRRCKRLLRLPAACMAILRGFRGWKSGF